MKRILGRIGTVLFFVCFIWGSGEFLIRVISLIKPVYSVEMIKYATVMIERTSDPALSHVHRTSISRNLMNVDLTLNSMGHRSAELRNPKPVGERRIFVLGNSITLGWGVSPEEVFTAVVESRLNHERADTGVSYAVINSGVANYNTVYEVELFKRQADAVAPDMVVLNYFINDAEPNPSQNNNPILKHSLFLAFLYEQVVGLKGLVKGESLSDHYRKLYEEQQPSRQRCKQAILELKAICAVRKIPLLVLMTPDTHNLDREGPFPALYEKALAAFRGLGVEVLNTYPVFYDRYGSNPKEVWVAVGDPHPNHKGHRLMADELYRYLSERSERGRILTN